MFGILVKFSTLAELPVGLGLSQVKGTASGVGMLILGTPPPQAGQRAPNRANATAPIPSLATLCFPLSFMDVFGSFLTICPARQCFGVGLAALGHSQHSAVQCLLCLGLAG